ncbi:hypothetical protein ACVBEJ_01750 [Porticoccus sp. GXU_MW_L64]
MLQESISKLGNVVNVPSDKIDQPVLKTLSGLLSNSGHQLLNMADQLKLEATERQRLLTAGQKAAEVLKGLDVSVQIELLQTFNVRVEVSSSEIRVSLNQYALISHLHSGPDSKERELADINFSIPTKLKRAGIEEKLIIPFDTEETNSPDPTLGKAVLKAFQWLHQLLTGQVKSIEEIAAKEGLCSSYIGHRLQLAFLSPQEVTALVEGRAINISLKSLKDKQKLPLSWQDR